MKRLFFTLLMTCLVPVAALAQSNTGNLVGSVSDASGVIPNATVVIKDKQTGKERTVQTSGQGAFTVPDLDVGTYNVTVTAAGHKTHISTDVKIDVGKEYSLPIVMDVGEVSENVTVVAGADIVNTANAELATNIGPRQLLELPLLTRNPLALILTSSGTASNPSQGTSINGQRTSSTNIVRDGVNINDNFIRANATDFAPQRPSVDDIAEFTISSQNSPDAGFGAAQLTLATPRGSNGFHGALFEYNRNSYFAANSFFNNATGVYAANDPLVLAGFKTAGAAKNPRPFRNRNQFGGKTSGPILKNKLFFFGYYEGLRDRVTASRLDTTLLPSALAGGFTYNRSDNGALQTVNILNPAFGTGITAIDPTIQARILSRLPGTNSTEAGDLRNTSGFRLNQQSNQDRDTFTTRIDYDINSNHSVYGIYNHVKEGNLRSDVDNTFNQVPLVTQPSTNNFVALGYRATFSPRLTNELTGGTYKSVPIFLSSEPIKSTNFILPTLVTDPEVTFLNQGRTVRTTNAQDNVTYLWGDHSLRFGGQFESVGIKSFNDAGTTPTYSLGTNINTPQISTAQFNNAALFPGGVPTAQRGTANSLLALLGGIVSAGSATFNVTNPTSGFVPGATAERVFAFKQYGAYFSDQWRVKPSLTLNLGIRYDYQTPLKMTNGLALEPIIAPGQNPVDAVLNPAGSFQFVGGNVGKPGVFNFPDRNNFAPILGLAWAPRFKSGLMGKAFGEGKTVIRAGYRMDYVNDEAVTAPNNALANNSGLQLASNVINPLTGTGTLNARVSALPAVPTPTFVNNRTFLLNNQVGLLQAAAFAVDPHLQVPRTQEYSFGITREIGFNTALEVRYVGSRGNNLTRASDFNQVDIRANGFGADFNRAINNCRVEGATHAGTGDPLFRCQNAAFNPALAGSVPLTVFPNLGGGGLLNNSTILAGIQAGTPADLAVTYIINALTGSVKFNANPNIFVADVINNNAFFKYNSLQMELRRRFAKGLWFNANYTFEKELTNAQGTSQTRVEALLDNLQPNLEESRADYDQTQVFNFSGTYDLPFGKGQRWLSGGGWADRLFGGWEVTSIARISTGAPVSLVDARGTLNRAARSGRQTAQTNLTTDQIKALAGVFRTPNGIFFINPTAANRNADGSITGTETGRAANGFATTFPGQVFFNDDPGTTSGLPRAFLNGPRVFTLDSSVLKRIHINERMSIQLRGEFFNILNHTAFAVDSQFYSINSTNFSRITSLAANPRIMQFAIRFEF
jgi:hypothetical protein